MTTDTEDPNLGDLVTTNVEAERPFNPQVPAARIWRVDWHDESWKTPRVQSRYYAYENAATKKADSLISCGCDVLLRVADVSPWTELHFTQGGQVADDTTLLELFKRWALPMPPQLRREIRQRSLGGNE